MRVGIFGREGDPGLSEMAAGVAASEDLVVWQRPNVWSPDQAQPFDVIILRGMHRTEEIRKTYDAPEVQILVMDLAVARFEVAKGDWHSVFWDRVNGYPQSGRVNERTARFFERIGPPCSPIEDVVESLILGQKPSDFSHGLDDQGLTDAYVEMRRTIRRLNPDAIVRFRPHPHGEYSVSGMDWIGGKISLDEEILLAREVYTVCSTAGIPAMLHGRPVYCHSSAPYARFSGHRLTTRAARLAMLRHVTRCQWSVAELRSGLAWRATKAAIKRTQGLPHQPAEESPYTATPRASGG